MSTSPNAPEERSSSPTATATMVDYQWIQVSRPFEIVKQQLLELDPPWLENAVRAAVEPREGAPLAARHHPDPALDVRVRVERPYVARGVFALPMEWEVTGSQLPPVLTGELELLIAGPGESRVGVRMRPRQELLPDGEEELLQTHRAVKAANVSFLNRVFWTLEALSRYDLLSDADVTTPLWPARPSRPAGPGGRRHGG